MTLSSLPISDLISKLIDNRGKTPPIEKEGHEYMEINFFKEGSKFPDYRETTKYVSNETYLNWFRTGHPQTGDVLLTTVGKIAATTIMSINRGCIAQNIIGLRPDRNKVDPDYLYYLLNTYEAKEGLKNLDLGVAQPSIKVPHVLKYQLSYLPLPSQQKVVGVLNPLDALIDQNQNRIQYLEEMAQLLFREWFVEFRFPGYAEYKLVDSEMGKIPEGWEMSLLGAHIKLDKGVSYNGEGLTDYGNPMVNLKSISVDGRFVRGSDKPYSGDYNQRHVIKPGDIILANTDMTQNGNVVGKAAIVPIIDTDKEIIYSHHIYAARIKKNSTLKKNFILNLLNSYYFHGHAKGYAVGTTVLGLSADSVYRFEFAYPDKRTTDLFEEETTAIYHLIENLENQNIVLQRTRDLLLPKLMSGEIDVSHLDINTTEN